MRLVPFLTPMFLSLYSAVLPAQSTNGSISGRVTDPSKAVIVDAKVAGINTGTSESVTVEAGAPAAVEMKRAFISNLRLLAEFAREPVSKDLKTAMPRSLALRETISSNLDKVRALVDGVLLEFGLSRERDLLLRDCIRQWQTHVRMLFILQNATWKYRAGLPGFELPEPIAVEQRQADNDLARMLDAIADHMEGQAI